MIEGIRNNFQVYLIGEETSWLSQLKKQLRDAGYKISSYRKIDSALAAVKTEPPHICLIDFDGQTLTSDGYLEAFSSISPETLHIAILGANRNLQASTLLEMGIYQILDKTQSDMLLHLQLIDRVTERIYYQYKCEEVEQESQEKMAEVEAKLEAKRQEIETILEKQKSSKKQEEDIYQKLRNHQSRVNQLELEIESSEIKTQKYISEYLKVKQEKEALQAQLEKEKKQDSMSGVSFSGLIQSFRRCHSVEDVLQDWLVKTQKLFGDTSAAFFKFIPGHSHLVLSQCAGLSIERVRGVGIPLLGLTPREQRSFYSHVRFFSNLRDLLKGAFNVSQFEFREVITDRGVIGIVVLFKALPNEMEKRYFADSVEILNLVCHRNSLAFKVHEYDTKDDLTQMQTRRAMDQALQMEITRCRRINKPLAALCLRLDDFRSLEKTWDVDVEKVVKAVSTIIRKTSRLNDLTFRVEKDEFVILLPHTDRKGAAIKAENLRRLVETAQIKDSQDKLIFPVTVSVGVSEYPSVCRDAEGLIISADEALLEVVEDGGNRVCMATSIDEHNRRATLRTITESHI